MVAATIASPRCTSWMRTPKRKRRGPCLCRSIRIKIPIEAWILIGRWGNPLKPRSNGPAGLGLRLCLELVADAVARLDEGVPRRAAIDLLPQPAHEDVDGPVAVRLAAAPQLLEQLVPRDDAAAVECELVQQLELRRRQLAALAVDIRLHHAGIDRQLLDLDCLAALRLRRAHPAACRRLHARDELVHRERLDEVIVGADLER